MKVRGVVVGIDHWNRLTGPLVGELKRHNPALDLVLVDNNSRLSYPERDYTLIRMHDRIGYAQALNMGAIGSSPDGDKWDWLITMNNDCWCHGNITSVVSELRDDTIYGPAWDTTYEGMIMSGFLYIPRRIWDAVGGFDVEMEAAFEDFDLFLRAQAKGFRLELLPGKQNLRHLFAHTRYETERYNSRWEKTRELFFKKHPNELVQKGDAHAYQEESQDIQR